MNNLSKLNQTPKDYENADKFLRKEHAKFTGVGVTDFGHSFFTENEQIERYSLNHAFWTIQDSKYNSSSTKGDISQRGLIEIMNKISFSFNEEMKEKIYKRSKEIVESEKITKSKKSSKFQQRIKRKSH